MIKTKKKKATNLGSHISLTVQTNDMLLQFEKSRKIGQFELKERVSKPGGATLFIVDSVPGTLFLAIPATTGRDFTITVSLSARSSDGLKP